MADPILRQRVAGRLVDGAPVTCRAMGVPIAECSDCPAHCAGCGCSDYAPCPGGCQWVEDGETLVCTRCMEDACWED